MASTLLIRHAQASFGTDCYDRLSRLGIQQAKVAGEYLALRRESVARVISGRLTRQRQTATELASRVRTAQGHAPQVEIDPRLDELDLDGHIARIVPRLDDPLGELAQNLALAKQSSRAYQKVIHRVFTHWQTLEEEPGLESWTAFAARTRSVIRDIATQSPPGAQTIAVTSGGVIAAIVQDILELPAAAAYALFEQMRNCSITQLLHTKDRLSVSSFNETSYLTAIRAPVDATDLITYR